FTLLLLTLFRSFLSRLLSVPPPHICTLFPYTTLFRSSWRYCETYYLLHDDGYFCRLYLAAGRHYPCLCRIGFNSVSLALFPGCRSEEHTSELQSRFDLVCRLLLEKKKISIDMTFVRLV